MYTNEQEIRNWLNKMGVMNYTINKDLTVDVAGSVRLNKKNLNELPVQFGVVESDFDISHNNLTSLKGSPHTVRDFRCNDNNLKTLEFGPDIVNRIYHCSYNQIETLEFLPSFIKDSFDCDHNKLKSLKGLEKFEELYTLFVTHNELSSLEYAPKRIIYALHINHNQLTDLNHLPEKLRVVLCSNNPLTPECLKDIPENLVAFDFSATQISVEDVLGMKFEPGARITFTPSGFAQDFELEEGRDTITVDADVLEKALMKKRLEARFNDDNATETAQSSKSFKL
jgi:hypothetical protein